MLHELNARARASVLHFLFSVAVVGSAFAQELPPGPPAQASITNLWDLSQTMNAEARVVRDVKLEGVVCAATDPAIGVIILRDNSGWLSSNSAAISRPSLPAKKSGLKDKTACCAVGTWAYRSPRCRGRQ